ncbi:MAG: type ISP restriction/modification enzyme, partial [Elusimicrobiota bacterium]
AFWQLAAHPLKAATELGPAFADFLARVMLHAAPLSDPKDLAWFLASYAREARHRIEHASAQAEQQLAALKESLESALGVSFESEKGEHFFRSTLAQTLFYGLFAAWVLQKRQGSSARFDWRSAAYSLHVPMISALFEQIAQPSKLRALELEEVLDWTTDALNRVDASAFFTKFQAEHSVQYFYEPFLQAFDPALRKELGVWYTPEEIVRYQVARVDAVLQSELGLPDGLADPSVVVLDPCCGTGAYLVEVLRLIAARLKAQGADALSAHELKKAAMQRLFGFELLPAPYVVAHLQIGLLLSDLGVPLGQDAQGKDERAGIYLTNALTGWEPAQEPKTRVLPFPEFGEERDAADAVKQTQKILVILGNPPYNGYANVAMTEERSLTDAYRTARNAPQPQGQGLNDLYVRFFRMTERQIVEKTGHGVVCYISNYSWLDGLSHTAMRERYLETFDQIWIDNLNGDKYRTGKLTPAGESDPSVFSTAQNREGIQVGTAIALMVRRRDAAHAGAAVRLRQWWGKTKLQDLSAEAHDFHANRYQPLQPEQALGLPFSEIQELGSYLTWPTLSALFPHSFPGVKTSRDAALVAIDRDRLEVRMRRYFDAAVPDAAIAAESPALMENTNDFDAPATRTILLKRGFLAQNIVHYCYRPFDLRWLYWEPETKLLDRSRPDYFPQVFAGNHWLCAVQQNRKQYDPSYYTSCFGSLHVIERGASWFPLYLRETNSLLAHPDAVPRANLSRTAEHYLQDMAADAQALFFHALAVIHSPAYRNANAGALRQDWPRIPLPASAEALRASAALGQQVAALLDSETPVPGVTTGAIREELKAIAVISRAGGGTLQQQEFALTAGWGHGGKNGVTMPGRGKVEIRAASSEELDSRLRGNDGSSQTLDVYLNNTAYWKNIPPAVWDYTIGGYQVIKKWLSYREQSLLGRPLSSDEVREVTAMARRIAALALLREELDRNYRGAGQDTYAWPSGQ